jgi:two-component system, NtrC family, sensor kinase
LNARLFVIAVVASVFSIGVCYFSLVPVVDALSALAAQETTSVVTRTVATVPALLILDAVIVCGAVFLLLLLMVGFPLNRMRALIGALERDQFVDFDTNGPLVDRVGGALHSLGRALRLERQMNRAQLAELHQNNAELQRLQSDLVSADRLATVGKLAAGVAHEVGNPLSGILGYLSLLRTRAASNPGSIELLDRVDVELQRIDAIVRSLLELGRPSRGGAEPFDARLVVDAAVRLMRASADLKESSVEVVGPTQVWARGESGPMSQVLVNLLLNASQAMNGKGRVTVTLSEAPPTITVDDQGPGIAAEVLPRLFELFFTTKPAGQGTGLGLAMSRHLLTQFGATLTAENRPGGGARFVVQLRPL